MKAGHIENLLRNRDVNTPFQDPLLDIRREAVCVAVAIHCGAQWRTFCRHGAGLQGEIYRFPMLVDGHIYGPFGVSNGTEPLADLSFFFPRFIPQYTEQEHLMFMIEESFTTGEVHMYERYLREVVSADIVREQPKAPAASFLWHSSAFQRAVAFCKLKDIH